jgi:type IV secretion system protein TrbE
VQFHKKVKRLIRALQNEDGSRISISGMPNGFFWKNLLWFGDALSRQTAVARGMIIEPAEQEGMDESSLDDLSDRLRRLIRTLGDEYQLMAKYLVSNDHRDILDRYRKETDSIVDRYRYRWQIWNRSERHARYTLAMNEGKLRRESLVIFFTRIVDSEPSFSVSEESLSKHFADLAERESEAFDQIQGDALNSLFPECRVQSMTDRDHFLYYYKFLNPSAGALVPESVLEAYDDSLSIQENCLFGDLVQPPTPGISFQMDGFNHAILVMRELPKMIGPGMITRLLALGFQDWDITVNLYPQKTREVVKKFEASANQLEGEVNSRPKERVSLGEELRQGQERIVELHGGKLNPVNVFFALRLWAKTADELISRASIAKNAFSSMASAVCHHATNAETARQLFWQTFPGWTYSTYRGFDIATDDRTAGELLPWSSSFTGRLDLAEALYDSPRGGLVGLTTQVGRVPQHILMFALTGAGKSLWLTDFFAQVLHRFGFVLIVEEGMSHGCSVQCVGGQPIVITPGGEVTINYLDLGGVPKTSEHLGSAVSLCLQMLRETSLKADPSRVSVLQSVLSQHIDLLYETSWQEWSQRHPEEANAIERRAYGIEEYRKRMPGQGNSFLDAWSEVRDNEVVFDDVDEGEVARFATHPSTRGIVRDLGLSHMSPEDMPTHSELVEMLQLTPIGGDENTEAIRIGDRLSVWRAGGDYGKLFDGVTTARLDTDITHFELGQISNSIQELRDAALFLVLNWTRRQVIKRKRAERKLLVFEEGARVIQLPGGAKTLQEFYTQMRKYGCCVCAVFQQASALQTCDPAVRASVIDNTKLFLVSAQPSPSAADDIAEVLELSETAKQAIKSYPLPEYQTGQKYSSFLMVAPDPRRKLVGTFRSIASREIIYAGSSDNEIFDERTKALSKYEGIVEGILAEARK